jgi:hypothetical protein
MASMPKTDDWTIERWKTEPRLVGLEFSDLPSVDPAPPLWKDLTVASALAVLLWAAAAVVFG